MSVISNNGGKIRGKRFRFHAAAPKPEETAFEVEKIPQLYFQKNLSSKSDIFKNVIISPDILNQKLPTYSKKDKSNLDVREAIENGVLNPGWKGRKKFRFHEVVESAKEFLKKRENEKKKTEKAILGNFHALEEALPALDQLIEQNKKKDNRPRAGKSFSKQDEEMMEDLQTHKQVLSSTAYSTDPFGTITDQLKQRLESGQL